MIDTKKIVMQNPTVKSNLSDFERKLSENENEIKEKIQKSYNQVSKEIEQQLADLGHSRDEVLNKFQAISKNIAICQESLPPEEIKKNELVNTLEKRNLDELLQLIKTVKDPSKYFPPIPTQTISTLLSFIQQTTFLVDKGDLVLEWIAACLMDIDIHQPMAKRFAPTLFKQLDSAVSKIEHSKQARAVRFIIDSLTIETGNL